MICPRSREEVDSYEYKDIPMRVGIHRKLFVKNVVAIGLSAGFIEPLESNGLFSVHVFLDRLVKTLASGSVNQFDRDVYNTACRGVFQNFAEFVAMHYAFSKRDDTAYWKANNDRVYDKGMTDLVPSMAVGFNHYHNNKMWQANIDPAAGLVWIATGMNHHIIDVLNQRNAEFIEGVATKDKFAQAFTSREQAQMNWWRNSEKEISLHQFLKENIHKDNS